MIFLRFFFYALVFIGKEYFYRIGTNSYFIGLAIILGYFYLLDGPIGKGKTIGKSLMNIGVRDYDALPLQSSQVFVRTVIAMNFFIFSDLIGRLFKIDSVADIFISNLIYGVVWGFLVANAILIGVHPLKQGMHDLLAKSLVTKDSLKEKYEVFIEKVPDYERLQGGAFQSAAIAFVVLIVLSGFMNFKYSFNEEQKEHLEQIKEARAMFEIEGFEFLGFKYGFLKEPITSLPVDSDSATSPVTTNGAEDAEMIYAAVFHYRTPHSFDPAEIENSREIREMMKWAGEWARDTFPISSEIIDESRIPPDIDLTPRRIQRIYFIFEKKINLTFLYQYSEDVRLHTDLTPE